MPYTNPRHKQSVLNRIVRGRGRRPWYFQVQLTRCALGQVPYANGDVMLDTRASDARAAAYTADGLLSLAVLGRLYLVVRWLRAALFARFDSPRLAARLADRPHRAVLAARVAILQAPLRTAAVSAASAALVLSYVYRVAEGRSRTSESSESVPHARARAGPARARRARNLEHHDPSRSRCARHDRARPPEGARNDSDRDRHGSDRDRGCRQQAHDGPDCSRRP